MGEIGLMPAESSPDEVFPLSRRRQFAVIAVFVAAAGYYSAFWITGKEPPPGLGGLSERYTEVFAIGAWLVLLFFVGQVVRGPVRLNQRGVYNPTYWRRSLREFSWDEIRRIDISRRWLLGRQLAFQLTGARVSVVPLEMLVDPDAFKEAVYRHLGV